MLGRLCRRCVLCVLFAVCLDCCLVAFMFV